MTYPDRDNPDYVHPSSLFKRREKTWYLLPIFLLIIGGIISYIILRNSDSTLARNTLLLGVILTAVLVAGLSVLFLDVIPQQEQNVANVPAEIVEENTEPNIIINDNTAPNIINDNTTPYSKMSILEIKNSALRVPYELLLKYNDVYEGDIIQYKGHVTNIQKNHERTDGSYVFKIEVYDTDDRPIVQDRLIWSNYIPKTERETAMIESIANNSGLFQFADSKNAVNVWGIMNGIKEYTIVKHKAQIPETDVLIIEMLINGESLVAPTENNLEQKVYTVSYDDIPDYVNSEEAVIAAMNDAMNQWTAKNPSITFEFTKYDDAELKIKWQKTIPSLMPGIILGTYSQYNVTTTGNEPKIVHEINIRLGKEDCSKNYQQFSHSSLRYTIAHEIGHFLGLMHISDQESLMYSSGWDHVDNVFSYKNLGYIIPELDRGEYWFMTTENITKQLEHANLEMETLIKEHHSLKNAQDTIMLAENKAEINALTQKIASLEDEKVCIGEIENDLWQSLSDLS